MHSISLMEWIRQGQHRRNGIIIAWLCSPVAATQTAKEKLPARVEQTNTSMMHQQVNTDGAQTAGLLSL